MVQLINVNLNQFIRFRLTENGHIETNKLIEKERQDFKLSESFSRKMIPDVDGYYRMSVWDFMSLYGNSCYLGGPTLFVDNNFQLIVD